MKPTKELTPTASAKLDNYIHINFEDVNEMTDAEQHSMELTNAGCSTDDSYEDVTDSEWDGVCTKWDEVDQWQGE
jgi:hypothetical protein